MYIFTENMKTALLKDGFYDYSKVCPTDDKEGDQYVCVCKCVDDGGDWYLFYECRAWSAGFFYDNVAADGGKPTEVLYFKELPLSL